MQTFTFWKMLEWKTLNSMCMIGIIGDCCQDSVWTRAKMNHICSFILIKIIINRYHAITGLDTYLKYTFGHFKLCCDCYKMRYMSHPKVTRVDIEKSWFTINSTLGNLSFIQHLKLTKLGVFTLSFWNNRCTILVSIFCPEHVLAEQCCLLQECYVAKFIIHVDDTTGWDTDTKEYHIMKNGDVVDDKELLSLSKRPSYTKWTAILTLKSMILTLWFCKIIYAQLKAKLTSSKILKGNHCVV